MSILHRSGHDDPADHVGDRSQLLVVVGRLRRQLNDRDDRIAFLERELRQLWKLAEGRRWWWR